MGQENGNVDEDVDVTDQVLLSVLLMTKCSELVMNMSHILLHF